MTSKRDTIAGRIPVLESLRAGKRRAHRLFLLKGVKGLGQIRSAAKGIPLEELSRAELDRLVRGAVHQGVVLEASPLPLRGLKDWLGGLPDGGAIALILDGVEDPRNFGGAVRSAAACGAAGVIFGKDRSAPLSTAAQKAAAGAMEHIDLVRVANLSRAIEVMQQAGFWVGALEAEAPKALWEADLTGRIALVVGSEGKGIRRLVSERCDLHLSIPLEGPITSLNASVSVGIGLAECLRQQRRREEPV